MVIHYYFCQICLIPLLCQGAVIQIMSVSSIYNEDRVNITHVEDEKNYSGSHSLHSSLHAYKYRTLISNPCDLSNEEVSSF